MHRNIKIFKWFNFFTDFRLFAPIAILYFTSVTGSFALGMSIFSVAQVSSAVLEIPTGIFSDRIGRKNTVIAGAVASVISLILYAIGGSYIFLLVGAIAEGFSRAFYSGNNDALLHDSLESMGKQHEFSEHQGKVSAMFQIALATSGLVGSVIAVWSFPAVMWLSVFPQLICLYLSFQLVDVAVRDTGSANVYSHLAQAVREFIGNPKLRSLSLADMISYSLGEAAYNFQSAFYQTLWPLWAIGIAKVLSNIGATISFYYSGKILKRWNAFAVLMSSTVFARGINMIATLFPTILSPLLMSATSLNYGVVSVAKGTLFQQEFSSSKRATMGSLNSFAGSMLFGVVSIVLGAVADRSTPGRAFLYVQVLSFSVLIIYWNMFKKYEGIRKATL